MYDKYLNVDVSVVYVSRGLRDRAKELTGIYFSIVLGNYCG